MVGINEIKAIIKSILVVRAKDGASMQEITDDYYDYTGETLQQAASSVDHFLNFLKTISGTYYNVDSNGTYLWYLDSIKTQHLNNMIKQQKQPHFNKKIKTKYNNYRKQMYNDVPSPNKCLNMRNHSYINNSFTSSLTHHHNNCANFYDYQLFGDDFFLSFAHYELNCQFLEGHRLKQCGFCISGQTIADAILRLRYSNNLFLNKNVIINLGSVDLIHGNELLDMKAAFIDLMNEFFFRGIKPIVTTLAPLANYGYIPEMRTKLEKFNKFLCCGLWNVIDIYSEMVGPTGNTRFECYQTDARYVTGSNRPHVLWNKIGRQRVLRLLKKNIITFQ